MDQLPNEILVEIFQHLSVIDLVNLSKIDDRFKHVINSTDKLKYFNLKFQKKNKTECERNRRYGQLSVSCYNSRIHQHILNICGSTIANIVFNTSDLSFPKIGTILRLCPNVKQVKFENVNVWPEVMRNLPELTDVYLELNESSSCILDLFLKSTVTALIILTKTEQYGTGIRGFLHTQPHLKSVYCKGQKVSVNFG
jgi:F-box domain